MCKDREPELHMCFSSKFYPLVPRTTIFFFENPLTTMALFWSTLSFKFFFIVIASLIHFHSIISYISPPR